MRIQNIMVLALILALFGCSKPENEQQLATDRAPRTQEPIAQITYLGTVKSCHIYRMVTTDTHTTLYLAAGYGNLACAISR